MKNKVLVVGSVAYDTIETPFGKKDDVLGGSASYFSAAAGFFAPVNLVAVVGEDFKIEEYEFLKEKGVDFSGLQIEKGKTFRWSGRYHENMNIRDTLFTELNVFENFSPVIPEHFSGSPFVFLANIDPDLQLDILNQVKTPVFAGLDTMNFWIEGKPEALQKVLKKVNGVIINDEELQQLTGINNIFKAAREVNKMGPEVIIIKKGEHGAVLITPDSTFIAPAFPLEDVFDPTGAGDTFAGGFMGYLAGAEAVTDKVLRKAIVYGTALASFTVEKFGLEALQSLTGKLLEKRVNEFKSYTTF